MSAFLKISSTFFNYRSAANVILSLSQFVSGVDQFRAVSLISLVPRGAVIIPLSRIRGVSGLLDHAAVGLHAEGHYWAPGPKLHFLKMAFVPKVHFYNNITHTCQKCTEVLIIHHSGSSGGWDERTKLRENVTLKFTSPTLPIMPTAVTIKLMKLGS